jgi:hypothetical protein
VIATVLPELNIYQSPGGPVIGTLRSGQVLKILYRNETLVNAIGHSINHSHPLKTGFAVMTDNLLYITLWIVHP